MPRARRIQGRRIQSPLRALASTYADQIDAQIGGGIDDLMDDRAPRRLGRRFGAIASIAAVVVVADQLSKWWAISSLSDRVVGVVWTLQFNLAHNTGAAFSLGRGSGVTRLLPLLVLGVVCVFIWQSRGTIRPIGVIATGMILGGALGNLVDRAIRTDGGGFFSGAVVDFIDLQWWPVFNVADMGVVVGGLLLLVAQMRAPATPSTSGTPGEDPE